MTAKYLLPCSCGRNTTVQASQAGEVVRCACGQELEVPTMRKLSELALSNEAAADEKPLWTMRQGIAFLGLVAIVGGLVFSGYLYANLPSIEPKASLRFEDYRKQIDDMPVANTVILWQILNEGLHDGDTIESVAVNKARADLMTRVYTGLGIAAAGLIVAVVAMLAKPAPMKP